MPPTDYPPLLTEPEPPRGVALDAGYGVRRVVAANPTPMTYHGTNTYLIDEPDGVTVIDPGPDDAAHVEAVVKAAGRRILRILITHTHHDHLGAAAALSARTGAPLLAHPASAAAGFTPDVPVVDGEAVGSLIAVHTPGHAREHLCLALPNNVLLTGDHVMGWSSTVVSPPGGDLRDYIASLRRLQADGYVAYLPGHGPAVTDTEALLENLLSRRARRERAIRKALSAAPRPISEIAATVYMKPNAVLQRAAERNLIAHLQKLEADGVARCENDTWALAEPAEGTGRP